MSSASSALQAPPLLPHHLPPTLCEAKPSSPSVPPTPHFRGEEAEAQRLLTRESKWESQGSKSEWHRSFTFEVTLCDFRLT